MAGLIPDSGGSEPISQINVTPFVDVVLVLLVIFIITAPALVKEVIGLNLPKANHADTRAATTLGIAVTKQGQILLNGEMVTSEALNSEITQALKKDPQAQAVISADADARHGDVVHAIDLIKTAGMNRFAIQIQRTQ